MKKPQRSTKAPAAPGKPLDPQKFPLGAQADATAGREKVREVAHRANAPRQSNRREERRAKSQTGT